jgi:hypothetical protein
MGNSDLAEILIDGQWRRGVLVAASPTVNAIIIDVPGYGRLYGAYDSMRRIKPTLKTVDSEPSTQSDAIRRNADIV